MSNVGQAALTIAGFAIGAAVGFPQLGFILGSLAGQALFPTRLPGATGPRLQDGRTTIAQLGSPVMEVFGTDSVPGVVMWMAPLRETPMTEEVGGKGGPSQEQTTFTYNQGIAVGLCRGPMGGLLRVWENGKLVYDTRPQLDTETDQEFLVRITAAGDYADTFTLYLGDETQLPDPTIELYRGVGEVPAFRGLMYVVFPDRQLLEEQGLRHPNFKFEVTAAQELSYVYSQEVLHPWVSVGNDPRNPLNEHIYNSQGSVNDGTGPGEFPQPTDDLPGLLNAAFGVTGQPRFAYMQYTLLNGVGGQSLLNPPVATSTYRFNDIWLHFNRQQASNLILNGVSDQCAAGISTQVSYVFGTGVTQPTGVPADQPSPGVGDWEGVTGCDPGSYPGGQWYRYTADLVFAVFRRPSVPDENVWTRIETGGPYRVLQQFSPNSGSLPGDKYPLGPALTPDDPNYDNEAFWTALYDQAVLDGEMAPGMSYGPISSYPAEQNFVWRSSPAAIGAPVSLATVITTICGRVGLGADQIDVSDLEDTFVNGYTLTRIMSGRDALDPLRNVGFFDVVESGAVIKFAARGKAVVRVLELTDLGSHEFGTEPPPAVKVNKTQDVDLPRVIRVHYKAPSRDYEDGEQISPSRSTTRAINDLDLEIAVSLPDDQAAKVAETIWADAWQGRTTYEVNLDSAHFDLEPGDAITLPVDGFRERARIVSADDSIPLLRIISLSRDDDGSYVAEALADAPGRTPGTMTILSTSDILFLDLPPLRFTDNDVGIYLTVRPTTVGATWRGAQIYLSTDEGVTFNAVATVGTEPTTGTVDVPLPIGDSLVWDDSATLTVTLLTGSLESRTEAAVLLGANALAIGVHGRWEIIQFTTVDQTNIDTYVLSHLLRGRRGTEYLMGTGEAGDECVLVSGGGIVRVPLTNADLDVVRIYKAVTLGMVYASGVDENFASGGQAMVPFSPVMIEGESDPDTGDMTISWLRRDRLGQELQSGTDVPMSEPPESYEVDIREVSSPPGSVVRTLESSVETVEYTALQQADDFGTGDLDIQIEVFQISPVVGRGTPGIGLATLLSNDVVYPEVTAEITLSGVFDVSQSFDVTVLFTPRSGSPVNVVSSVSGAGKASFDDMAVELASELDAGLPSTVVVSQVGAVVTLTTTAGFLSVSAVQNVPVMNYTTIQEPLPITAAVQQYVSFDLYISDWPVSNRAPDADASYQVGGVAYANWTVYGLDWLTNRSIGYGVNQNTSWGIPNGIFNYRIQALTDLGPAILAALPQYVEYAAYGAFVGSVRPGIIVRMKPGYFIAPTVGSNFSNAGSHPAGYSLEVEYVGGMPLPTSAFPAGAKQRTSIYIGNGVVAGMIATIVLNGTPFSHTITGPEAADPYGPGFDTVYDDFKTIIEASGDYDVFLYKDGDVVNGAMDIERNIIDTPFTTDAFFETDLTIGIVIT